MSDAGLVGRPPVPGPDEALHQVRPRRTLTARSGTSVVASHRSRTPRHDPATTASSAISMPQSIDYDFDVAAENQSSVPKLKYPAGSNQTGRAHVVKPTRVDKTALPSEQPPAEETSKPAKVRDTGESLYPDILYPEEVLAEVHEASNVYCSVRFQDREIYPALRKLFRAALTELETKDPFFVHPDTLKTGSAPPALESPAVARPPDVPALAMGSLGASGSGTPLASDDVTRMVLQPRIDFYKAYFADAFESFQQVPEPVGGAVTEAVDTDVTDTPTVVAGEAEPGRTVLVPMAVFRADCEKEALLKSVVPGDKLWIRIETKQVPTVSPFRRGSVDNARGKQGDTARRGHSVRPSLADAAELGDLQLSDAEDSLDADGDGPVASAGSDLEQQHYTVRLRVVVSAFHSPAPINRLFGEVAKMVPTEQYGVIRYLLPNARAVGNKGLEKLYFFKFMQQGLIKASYLRVGDIVSFNVRARRTAADGDSAVRVFKWFEPIISKAHRGWVSARKTPNSPWRIRLDTDYKAVGDLTRRSMLSSRYGSTARSTHSSPSKAQAAHKLSARWQEMLDSPSNMYDGHPANENIDMIEGDIVLFNIVELEGGEEVAKVSKIVTPQGDNRVEGMVLQSFSGRDYVFVKLFGERPITPRDPSDSESSETDEEEMKWSPKKKKEYMDAEAAAMKAALPMRPLRNTDVDGRAYVHIKSLLPGLCDRTQIQHRSIISFTLQKAATGWSARRIALVKAADAELTYNWRYNELSKPIPELPKHQVYLSHIREMIYKHREPRWRLHESTPIFSEESRERKKRLLEEQRIEQDRRRMEALRLGIDPEDVPPLGSNPPESNVQPDSSLVSEDAKSPEKSELDVPQEGSRATVPPLPLGGSDAQCAVPVTDDSRSERNEQDDNYDEEQDSDTDEVQASESRSTAESLDSGSTGGRSGRSGTSHGSHDNSLHDTDESASNSESDASEAESESCS